jgi:hypothetical protein
MTVQEEYFKDDDESINAITVENVESGIIIVIEELLACYPTQRASTKFVGSLPGTIVLLVVCNTAQKMKTATNVRALAEK